METVHSLLFTRTFMLEYFYLCLKPGANTPNDSILWKSELKTATTKSRPTTTEIINKIKLSHYKCQLPVCKNFVFILLCACWCMCVCVCVYAFFCSGLFKFLSRSVFAQALGCLNENSLVIRQWKNCYLI